jgi:hypothetical protein
MNLNIRNYLQTDRPAGALCADDQAGLQGGATGSLRRWGMPGDDDDR